MSLVLLIVGLVVTGAGLWSGRQRPPTEVFLEPADSVGEAPFTPSAATPLPPAAAATLPPPVPPPAAAGTPQVVGTSPGLFGGLENQANCNAQQIISYLEANPDRARPWARALGLDAAQIRTFISGLTPVVLRTDTRLTNYGLQNGRAVPLQSVLQANTSVLVDNAGVPRVRCGSGNPLGPPRAVTTAEPGGTPRFRGRPWPAFRPGSIVVIGGGAPIGDLIIVDLNRGVVIVRRPGITVVDRIVDRLPILVLPNDPVVITGRQFPPGTVVTISFDAPAIVLGTATANGAGEVAATVRIPPNAALGLHLVTAAGGGVRTVLPVYVLPPG